MALDMEIEEPPSACMCDWGHGSECAHTERRAGTGSPGTPAFKDVPAREVVVGICGDAGEVSRERWEVQQET